ncbi:MAG: hypothetical protein K6E16_10645 [Lachnospiraceae bacterium]|nr:hypothetical protein [Lachnospiraceae bacterium]
MNRFLDKMEKKIGRYAISNLSLYLIVGYVIGYVLGLTGSLEFLNLNPYLILRGQVWRIVTWVLMPPTSFSIFTIIMLFFYYSIGRSLERTWGTFRYNVYLFSGMLFSILGAFALYAFCSLTGAENLSSIGSNIGSVFSTYYVTLSIFLAFAACYPDMRVLLYFFIPVKIKWLAYLDIVILLASFFNIPTVFYAAGQGMNIFVAFVQFGLLYNFAVKVAIIASLLNFLIFFLSTRNLSRIKPSEVHRRAEYRRQTQEPARMKGVTKHKCAICGRTEEDGEDLEFRFCSKCNGNYEYCQDHLFTHKHIL